MKIILENERIEDEIPDFVQENFTKSPPMLELSGVFCEEDIPYNEEEYTAHLKESMAFAEQNPNYTLKCSTTHAFNNLNYNSRGTMGDGVQRKSACNPFCHSSSQASQCDRMLYSADNGR